MYTYSHSKLTKFTWYPYSNNKHFYDKYAKYVVKPALDYNAKHNSWGSRLITPEESELMEAFFSHKVNEISTGYPTYWPTYHKKIPDVVDFAVI